jgi:hypothetical protein
MILSGKYERATTMAAGAIEKAAQPVKRMQPLASIR